MSELDLERHVQRREDGTGWIKMSIPESELTYFVDLVWNFGSEAHVLGPKEAITSMKRKLETLLEKYK